MKTIFPKTIVVGANEKDSLNYISCHVFSSPSYKHRKGFLGSLLSDLKVKKMKVQSAQYSTPGDVQ